MVIELKILQANTSNLFKVLMRQEKKKKKKNELLKLYVWDEKKEGPTGTVKALEASLRATRKDL
jgi:hypothetical protein